MASDDRLPLVGLFVGLLVLTVIVGAAVAAGGSGSAPTVEDLSVQQFTSADTVATVPEETGDVEMDARAAGEVVVIDAGHGASIDDAQLEPLVTTLTENGAEVQFISGERSESFNASLRRADAYVAFGAETGYTSGELAALEAFADAGGRVLMLNEPSQSTSLGGLIVVGAPTGGGGVPAPMKELASRFGIAYGNGYLYDMQDYDLNYRNVYVSPSGGGDLTEGVDRLVFHESTPVTGGEAMFQTSETAELSQTRTQGHFDVVVRSGNVVAVGDTSVVSQDYYRRADNEVLVGNLLDFLVSGEKRPENAPRPTDEGESPRPVPRPSA